MIYDNVILVSAAHPESPSFRDSGQARMTNLRMRNNINNFYKKLEDIVKLGATPKVIESGQGPYLTINGKKKLNFCSSHYLGLAVDNRLKLAVKKAVEKYGIGTGYRTLAGTHILHVELENALARFKKAEGAIVVSGGYLANMAAIQTIIGKEDIVISDELNHASIIDAVRLSQVKNKFIYKHADAKSLEEQLKEADKLRRAVIATPSLSRGKQSLADGIATSPSAPRNDISPLVLIVTDGVFSMDGDLAENAEYVAAREELSFIDGRMDELEELLKQAVLIRDSKASSGTVKLGSKVTLHIKGKKETFMLVGEWEADPKEKKISHESPLGKALIGKKVGEKVEVEAPAGKISYNIISIN